REVRKSQVIRQRNMQQHAVGCVRKPVGHQVNMSIEQGELNAEISLFSGFPTKVWIYLVVATSVEAAIIVVKQVVDQISGISVPVGAAADGLITNMPPACSQFPGAQPVGR